MADDVSACVEASVREQADTSPNTTVNFAGYTWQKDGYWGYGKGKDSSDHPYALAESGLVNGDAVCAYASRINKGVPCRIEAGLGFGASNIVREISFEDGQRWIIRISRRSIAHQAVDVEAHKGETGGKGQKAPGSRTRTFLSRLLVFSSLGNEPAYVLPRFTTIRSIARSWIAWISS